MTTQEFWHNHCTDDWSDPIKIIYEYNYVYIVEGATYWLLLKAERWTEINARLSKNGQPRFEEPMSLRKRALRGVRRYVSEG